MSTGRFWLTVLPLVGAGLGYLLQGVWGGIAAGSIVAGSLLVADAVRTLRLRAWLRAGAVEPPPGNGERSYVAHLLYRMLVTQRRSTLAADRRLEEFLAAIQASPNGVTLLDGAARIEWCNATAAQHFGFEMPRDERQLIGNLVRDPVFAAYMAAGDFSFEVQLSRPGGARLAIQLHGYGDGKLLLISRDVTAIEQAAQMRRDFVANVSHEVKTPLTVLKGFVETLQSLQLDDSERRHYLSLMAEQTARMEALVADLLTLSRIEALPQAPLDRCFDVSVLLQKIEQQMQQTPWQIGVFALKNEAPIGLMLAANEVEAFGALLNLLTNALRYSPAGSPIELRVCLDTGGNLLWQVRDQGPGIAPEHLPRLTERFYRVDTSRSRETGGTGLGLAIVKHSMQRHGGALLIESTVGQGSCFTLQWPATRVRVAPDGASGPEGPKSSPP